MPALRCAVVGAGVVGLCVAMRLAEAGATVTLLERDEPGCGATRSSFAWLNANNKIPRAYHDLNHAGMRAWASLAARAGQPAWYQASGNLEWAPDARGHAELVARVRRLTGWGYPAGFSRCRLGGRAGTGAAAVGADGGGRLVSRGELPADRARGWLPDPGRRRRRGPLAGGRGGAGDRIRAASRPAPPAGPAGGRGTRRAHGGRRGDPGGRGRVLCRTRGSGAGPAGGCDQPGAARAVAAARGRSTRPRRARRARVRPDPDGARTATCTCGPMRAARSIWKPPTRPPTCTRPTRSCGAGRTSCCGAPAGSSADWTRPRSPATGCACARCPPMASRSWGGCPAPPACTWP